MARNPRMLDLMSSPSIWLPTPTHPNVYHICPCFSLPTLAKFSSTDHHDPLGSPVQPPISSPRSILPPLVFMLQTEGSTPGTLHWFRLLCESSTNTLPLCTLRATHPDLLSDPLVLWDFAHAMPFAFCLEPSRNNTCLVQYDAIVQLRRQKVTSSKEAFLTPDSTPGPQSRYISPLRH